MDVLLALPFFPIKDISVKLPLSNMDKKKILIDISNPADKGGFQQLSLGT